MNDEHAWYETLVAQGAVEINVLSFTTALLVSFLSAVAVSALYRGFYSNRAGGSEMDRSFLLLGPSITALFLTIQFSVPLSLGLFGVFAMIRFRNPVRDPEEIGFVMLLVSSAVVCASSRYELLVIFLVLTTIALSIRKYVPRQQPRSVTGVYVITMNARDGSNIEDRIRETLRTHLPEPEVLSFSYSEGLLTTHCRFSGRRRQGVKELEDALEEIGAVQQLDVFFSNRDSPG